ncbi:MAG: hypothetical protein R3F43_13195 [bacterium]
MSLVPTLLRRLLHRGAPPLPVLRAVSRRRGALPRGRRASRPSSAWGRSGCSTSTARRSWAGSPCDGHGTRARPGTVGRALAGLRLGVVDGRGGPRRRGPSGRFCRH